MKRFKIEILVILALSIAVNMYYGTGEALFIIVKLSILFLLRSIYKRIDSFVNYVKAVQESDNIIND
jgi:hypothetical protein